MKFRCYRVYESCAVCVSGLFYLAPGIIRGPGGLQNARPTVSDSFASHCLATSTHTQNCLEDSKEFWRKVDANSIEIAVVVWKRSNHLLIFFCTRSCENAFAIPHRRNVFRTWPLAPGWNITNKTPMLTELRGWTKFSVLLQTAHRSYTGCCFELNRLQRLKVNFIFTFA